MEPGAVPHRLKVLESKVSKMMDKADVLQRSGLTMFVRDFQALDIPAIFFTKGYLAIWEAVEGIECLQMPLDYLWSTMVCHMLDERGAKLVQEPIDNTCKNAQTL